MQTMTLRIAPVALLSIVTQSAWWQAISAADAETAFGERQALCDRDKGALRGVFFAISGYHKLFVGALFHYFGDSRTTCFCTFATIEPIFNCGA